MFFVAHKCQSIITSDLKPIFFQFSGQPHGKIMFWIFDDFFEMNCRNEVSGIISCNETFDLNESNSEILIFESRCVLISSTTLNTNAGDSHYNSNQSLLVFFQSLLVFFSTSATSKWLNSTLPTHCFKLAASKPHHHPLQHDQCANAKQQTKSRNGRIWKW